MKNKAVKNIFIYIFLFVLSALFVTAFAFSINPVTTNEIELDASCFYVIGRDMLKGKMPYVDFVDNKGPITYIVYALSALISSFPWGIFAVSILMVFVSLVLIKCICTKLNIRHPIALCFVYLFFYICICSKGGYTEDMTLPLTLGAFAVLLYFEERFESKKRIIVSGVLYGALFWLCAFTRINNAVAIGTLTAFSGIQLLTKKQVKDFFIFAGSFLIGTAAVIIPISVWLGANGALSEALNQFILNNFKYSSADTAVPLLSLFGGSQIFGYKLYILAAIGFICPLVFQKQNGKKYTPVTVAAMVTVAVTAMSFVVMTNPFSHYVLIIFVPAFFGFMLLFSGHSVGKTENSFYSRVIALLCCVAVLTTFKGLTRFKSGADYSISFARATLNGTLTDMPSDSDMGKSVRRIADYIPENERDSVFSIDINPCFYALSGISPYKRIFVCTTLFTSISDEYKNEFIGYFEDEPPKWLVTAKPLEETEICDGFEKQLVKQYKPVDSVPESFYLYKLGE